MLTRIEIDGFKTFERFDLHLRPFLAILGRNATGKSNLFDAIRLLSRLADRDLLSAFTGLRGEPLDLFRCVPGDEPVRQMRLAAEVLLEPNVTDPWGTRVELTHTRFRYEVTVERRPDQGGNERLFVSDESATQISKTEDRGSALLRQWLDWESDFHHQRFRYSRRSPLLVTEQDDRGRLVFRIRQDGVPGRPRPASAAEATVLSSITGAEHRHLFALRQELRSWRLFQPDPATLRKPSPVGDPGAGRQLNPDGSNLASVLHRIERETADPEHGGSLLADINADLVHLIPGLREFDVVEDRAQRWHEIRLAAADEAPHPAAVASDGTLRVLALLTALHDPDAQGLICFEEPENGVHPARLHDLVRLLRGLATEPVHSPDPETPLTQLLLASHSPVVLAALKAEDVVFTDMVSVVDPEAKTKTRRTRILPVRADKPEQLTVPTERTAPRSEISRYLATTSLEREAEAG